jgi:hypothetical protein
MRQDVEIIELVAANPEGDLACDTTIATPEARAGLFEAMRAGFRPPTVEIEGGVEVTFAPGARDAVIRYVELESRCCSFLTLAVETRGDAIKLRVTGREDALPWIREIFAGAAGRG